MNSGVPKDSDLIIEVVDRFPKGGQQVGTMLTEVKVTHIPSGMVVVCGAHRSQYKNKQTAVSMIEWGLACIENQ